MYDEFIFNKRLEDVYDCEGYTTAEVLSYFYDKINNFVERFNELEMTTDERLEYLLGEGLNIEVARVINEMYADGRLSDILNQTLLNDLTKIVTEKLPYKVSKNDLQLYSNEIEIKKGDYSIYECQVVNPVNADRENEIIFIKCSFPKSTVFTEKNITVMDSNNNSIPFEIIKDTHPNPRVKYTSNLSIYADGSIKHCYIVISQTILANQKLVFKVKILDQEQTKNFAKKIEHSEASSDRKIIVGEHYLTINFTPFVKLNRYNKPISNEDFPLIIPEVKNSSGTLSFLNNVTPVNVVWSGNGIIYKEVNFTLKMTSNESFYLYQKVRVYCNGNFDVSLRVETNATVDKALIDSVNFKYQQLSANTTNQEVNQEYIFGNTNGAKSITKLKFFQYMPDGNCKNTFTSEVETFNNSNSYGTTLKSVCSTSNKNNFNKEVFWGAHFSNSEYVVTSNHTSGYLKLMNPLFSRLAFSPKYKLREQIRNLSLTLFRTLYEGPQSIQGNHFEMLNQLAYLTHCKILGFKGYGTVKQKVLNVLNTLYNGGSTDGFYAQYRSGTINQGIEYSGRNMSVIPYLLEESKIVAPDDVHIWEEYIHAYADFIVKVEVFSGGEGKIILSDNVGDNCNAEATALRYLKYSLNLEENSIRQNCYDRIKTRLENSIAYNTIFPYRKDNDITIKGLLHYHNFTLFEYVHAEPSSNINTIQYINEMITPAGLVKEIECERTKERRGFIHTLLYASYINYKYNTISSLQESEQILEHIISKTMPDSTIEFPIDGWLTGNGSDTIDLPIWLQVLSEIILDTIYFNK